MATMTIRMPDEKHRRRQQLAETCAVSLNRLVDELSTVALVQHDAAVRFHKQARDGKPADGLRLLDKLDQALAAKSKPARR